MKQQRTETPNMNHKQMKKSEKKIIKHNLFVFSAFCGVYTTLQIKILDTVLQICSITLESIKRKTLFLSFSFAFSARIHFKVELTF